MVSQIGIFTHNFPRRPSDRQNAGVFVSDLYNEISKKVQVKVFSPYNFGKKLGDTKLWNPIDLAGLITFFISGVCLALKEGKENSVNVAMWAFPSGVFTYVLKKIYKTPYIIWCLGSDINVYGKTVLGKFIVKELLKNASYVFADGIELSKTVKRDFGVECLFVPSVTGIEERAVKTGAKKGGPKTITYLGRLERVKGPDILIDALVQIGARARNLKVNIVGDGSLSKDLRERAEKKIQIKVNFWGNVSDEGKLADILSTSDWLIIPSRSDSVPLVFSEAMKNGLPIIASNLPDVSYLIEKYDVGIIFQSENSRKLARILTKLSSWGRKRTFFAENTKKAAKDFNLEKSAETLLSYCLKAEKL